MLGQTKITPSGILIAVISAEIRGIDEKEFGAGSLRDGCENVFHTELDTHAVILTHRTG